MDQVRDPGHDPSSAYQRGEGGEETGARTSILALVHAITCEFELVMGRPERAGEYCSRLRHELSQPLTAEEQEQLATLTGLLSLKAGPLAAPLFELLAHAAASCENPWPLLAGLLAARDPDLARRALDLTAQLAESGALSVSRKVAAFLAERLETEGSILAEPLALQMIARILRRLPPDGGHADPVLDLYRRAGAGPLSRLAARLLDLDGQPVPDQLAAELLSPAAHSVLRPYLDYTCATHIDLLHLVPERGQPPPVLPSLRQAEAVCGAELVREVIATLGWQRLNLGLEVREVIGLSIAGSIPVLVSPAEASLIESCMQARRVWDSCLFIAEGTLPVEQVGGGMRNGAVSRFRAYNLAHAEALADILDIAPLTREKVQRILRRMDGIVADFVALFASHSEECEILPGVYAELKQRVAVELEKEISTAQLSPELTRLVQMFDDPSSLGEVQTLHGLKRYLHQRGLKLGLQLVAAGLGTNRTVSLVVTSRGRVLRALTCIQYADFEAASRAVSGAEGGTCGGEGLPFAVGVIVNAFGHQLLHGQEIFPSVKVFCYGNEVHYYLAFKNHPAFMRVDYAPPLKGGMIDLEYYGVSNYELSVHPNPSLEAIRRFFRRLDFDVQIDATRIHARYDKERALDLADLCDKAAALCRLVPYLMDVDWIIGGLDLDSEARAVVAQAWADRFALSGVLPVAELLTRDRRSILVAVGTGPEGEREVAWSGRGPYRDRFPVPSTDRLGPLRDSLERLAIDIGPPAASSEHDGVGQTWFERHVLGPLRQAVARGELLAAPGGFHPCPPERFRRRHEAEVLAEILGGEVEALISAARLAELVGPLERSLRFRTTGSVNAYEVQRARLPLLGEHLGLYVLRDAGGIIRLALFAYGEVIFNRRDDVSHPWSSNAGLSAHDLAVLLRRSNYLTPLAEPPSACDPEEAARIRETFRGTNPIEPRAPLPGERLVSGLRASPGRAVGRVLFTTAGRTPGDMDGAVLVAASVRPEDGIFLHHAAGIVSTGGGILSHAGLIATQLRKPALIISGRWREARDGTLGLIHSTLEYSQEMRDVGGYRVALWRGIRERENCLYEGDLVVVDADEGTLRVIGHDREALALHDGFRRLAAANRRLAYATDEVETLLLRGRQLQARYQIGKLLGRLGDPVIARHAVDEILLGEVFAAAAAPGDRAQLLSLVLDNPWVRPAAREGLLQIERELRRRRQAAAEKAERSIPTSRSTLEILWLRLAVRRLHRILEGTTSALAECGLDAPAAEPFSPEAIDRLAARRLAALRRERVQALRTAAGEPAKRAPLRHALREVRRLDLLLGAADQESEVLHRCADELAHADELACRNLSDRRILGPEDGGFELHPLVGWKAANLAEVERLGGPGCVPPWFALTDRAFNEVLDEPLQLTDAAAEVGPPAEPTLRAAVNAVLARPDLGPAQKSALIRQLWDQVTLPPELVEDVAAAYRRLGDRAGRDAELPGDAAGPFVAVRSSSREEDVESAARAGEFDTFLFIRGEDELLAYLKRAWSGLWTERAIHSRTALGLGAEGAGGGVIVQHLVRSRVSGVLQTVNIAENELREMVINAGLGLGEGIVSGTVAADQIVVSKGDDLKHKPLRFRYITNDKRSRVVCNERAGLGTVLVETLYHQRLRPALEYVELCELVAKAAELEAVYSYPLDIEFGIEGTRLWILQVRPLAVYLPALKATLAGDPLCGRVPSEEALSDQELRS